MGCHCQWFRVDECNSGEFISLRAKKTLNLHSSLPLHYRALREKVDEIALKPAGTKQETVKFSFALFTFKFSFAACFVKTTIMVILEGLFIKPKHVQIAQKRNYCQ